MRRGGNIMVLITEPRFWKSLMEILVCESSTRVVVECL
jgi:hypothetical protein